MNGRYLPLTAKSAPQYRPVPFPNCNVHYPCHHAHDHRHRKLVQIEVRDRDGGNTIDLLITYPLSLSLPSILKTEWLRSITNNE